MIPTIQILVLLLVVVAAVAVVAARLKILASILLVLTGIVLAIVPGVPSQNLNPDVLMMEPAEHRYRCDAAGLLPPSKIWSVFIQ